MRTSRDVGAARGSAPRTPSRGRHAGAGRGALAPRRRPAAVLSAFVLVYLALAVTVILARPPWEAIDEVDHVRNVETLVSGSLYRMTPGSGLKAMQPPLYYAAEAAWQRVHNVIVSGDPLALVATRRYNRLVGGVLEFGGGVDPLRQAFVEVPESIWKGFWYSRFDHLWPW